MHDIKAIREDHNLFSKKLDHRNIKIDLENILDLDNKVISFFEILLGLDRSFE